MFVARGRLGAREVQALRDVSLDGRAGRGGRPRRAQRLGQVDAAAARLRDHQADDAAASRPAGRIASLLELGAGFHPDFTGRENVYLNGSIHGLSRARVREAMDEIVAFAELEQFIDLPVRTYSSGMYMRLGFSVAAHIRSDVLLLDEVFAVGDEQFQRKCFGKIAEFKNRGGTIVFVSHDAQAVERLCDRAVLLRQGEVAFDGVDAGGDRRLPPAARRRREPGGARGRACASGAAARRASSPRRSLDADGDERAQFAAGEPATVALRRRRARRASRAPRVTLELRDDGGLVLGASPQTPPSSAGTAAPASASCASSSTGCRSPTAASTCVSR